MSNEFPTPSESKQGLDCRMNDDHDLGRYDVATANDDAIGRIKLNNSDDSNGICSTRQE